MTDPVPQLVDTHCHLDFDRFDPDREAVIARAAAAGVTRIVVPALDLDNCPTVLALTERYSGVYAAVGVHPNSSASWQASWLTPLRRFARHPRVVAIGEIGLDYYWDRAAPEIQRQALAAQLALAAELALPVILHNRDASDDLLQLLASAPTARRPGPGVLHSFSADWTTAAKALELGYFLGFTGPITFKKATDLQAVARRAPLERILVETDAPFLTPEPHRGRRNEPAYVRHVAAALAALHELPLATMAQLTTDNAERLFGLDAGS